MLGIHVYDGDVEVAFHDRRVEVKGYDLVRSHGLDHTSEDLSPELSGPLILILTTIPRISKIRNDHGYFGCTTPPYG